jgi:hypothetical protein
MEDVLLKELDEPLQRRQLLVGGYEGDSKSLSLLYCSKCSSRSLYAILAAWRNVSFCG